MIAMVKEKQLHPDQKPVNGMAEGFTDANMKPYPP
jgi:hypothetical protein